MCKFNSYGFIDFVFVLVEVIVNLYIIKFLGVIISRGSGSVEKVNFNIG